VKLITLNLEDSKSDLWNTLPPVCQNILANNALNAILGGTPYPTGTDQLELAIELAENGTNPSLITRISGLHASVFESFIAEK